MKKTGRWLAVIVLLSGVVAAQEVPAPAPDEPVEKVSTQLIQIDVTVTDKNGKVVQGLTADDFEIIENGEKQGISNISFISKVNRGVIAAGTEPIVNDPTGLPRALTAGEVRRTIAVVVDDLNLSFLSVDHTRKALRRFVDLQMEPSDLVAIIRTGGGVGTLQQFTSDKRLLHAAIDKIRWNPLGGSFDSLASVGQTDADISDRFTRESDLVAGGKTKQTTVTLTRESATEKKADDFKVPKIAASQEEGLYAQTSLGTVRYVIAGITQLPGRKTLMFFSDGITIGNESNKSRSASVFKYLEQVVDVANRSSVVVYTFDTKGMRSMSIGASDNTYEIIDGHRGAKERERTFEFKESQDGLSYFARQTGGKAVLNTDDLGGGIQRALDEQTGYYLLAYMPDAENFDPVTRKLNQFSVKVKRTGLNVSYRSGFFVNGPADAGPSQLAADREMADALLSPFSRNGIALNMNALFARESDQGAYVRTFLHIDARDLRFSDAKGGWKTAVFDVAAMLVGDEGAKFEKNESKFTIRTKGPTYEAMLRNGFVYVLMIPVAKPGLYQCRVALRDAGSGKIGSASQVIDVPDLSKKRLAVSSLVVEGVSPAGWQGLTQGSYQKVNGQVHAASTLMYDTVLRQFAPGNILRYGFEAYNLTLDQTSRPQIETQASVLQDGATVVEGKINRLDSRTLERRHDARVSGALTLTPDMAAGDYVFRVVVRDLIAGRESIQLLPFQIVSK
jgi:VWFA-related protein